MNAPLPNFTSSTRASRPSASFLLMMLAVISGIDATVRGHIAQGVELAIGRNEIGGRAGDDAADAFDNCR